MLGRSKSEGINFKVVSRKKIPKNGNASQKNQTLLKTTTTKKT